MTTPAAPQGAPAPAPATTPPAATPPVPTPPPSGAPAAPAVPTAPASTQPAAPAAAEPSKTFTQDDLDRILTDRLARQEKTFTDKFAQALGITDPNAVVDPAKALADSQAALSTAQSFAQASAAEALALAAGIKPEKVGDFVRLVDLKGALKNIDAADPAAVRAALKTAVDTKATAYPEWTGSALPGSSGGDRSGAAGNGKKTWTRDEISKLSQDDLAKNADELMAAYAENRIV